MLKHEINFNGKKLALDRKEIIELLPALEPYYVGIMIGATDFEMPEFVKDYMSNVSGSRNRAKKAQGPKTAKKEKVEEKQPYYENNIYDMEYYRKEKQSNG